MVLLVGQALSIGFINQYVSSEVMGAFANAWRTEQARIERYQRVPSDDIKEIPPLYNERNIRIRIR